MKINNFFKLCSTALSDACEYKIIDKTEREPN